jgi:hypothetical protein
MHRVLGKGLGRSFSATSGFGVTGEVDPAHAAIVCRFVGVQEAAVIAASCLSRKPRSPAYLWAAWY